MHQNVIHKQPRSQVPRTKRYVVHVPQEFVQVFHVEAQSSDEAIELVRDRPADAEERGIYISSSDPHFIQDLEEKHWLVEQSG